MNKVAPFPFLKGWEALSFLSFLKRCYPHFQAFFYQKAPLEFLIPQNIRAVNDSLHLHYDIHFWRTASGLEVDFILYGPNGFHAIEIKRSRTIGQHDLSALEAFKKEYPEASCWIVFGGDRYQYFDSITAVPFKEFLFDLKKILGRQ